MCSPSNSTRHNSTQSRMARTGISIRIHHVSVPDSAVPIPPSSVRPFHALAPSLASHPFVRVQRLPAGHRLIDWKLPCCWSVDQSVMQLIAVLHVREPYACLALPKPIPNRPLGQPSRSLILFSPGSLNRSTILPSPVISRSVGCVRTLTFSFIRFNAQAAH